MSIEGSKIKTLGPKSGGAADESPPPHWGVTVQLGGHVTLLGAPSGARASAPTEGEPASPPFTPRAEDVSVGAALQPAHTVHASVTAAGKKSERAFITGLRLRRSARHMPSPRVVS